MELCYRGEALVPCEHLESDNTSLCFFFSLLTGRAVFLSLCTLGDKLCAVLYRFCHKNQAVLLLRQLSTVRRTGLRSSLLMPRQPSPTTFQPSLFPEHHLVCPMHMILSGCLWLIVNCYLHLHLQLTAKGNSLGVEVATQSRCLRPQRIDA